MTKLLLMVSALLAVVVGVAALIMPVVTGSLLVGATVDTPAGLVAGRIAGAAILSLGLACWQTRNGEGAAIGVVSALLVYNAAAAMILVYAGVWLKLQSTLLWLAIVIHWVMAGWCLVNIWMSRRQLSKRRET